MSRSKPVRCCTTRCCGYDCDTGMLSLQWGQILSPNTGLDKVLNKCCINFVPRMPCSRASSHIAFQVDEILSEAETIASLRGVRVSLTDSTLPVLCWDVCFGFFYDRASLWGISQAELKVVCANQLLKWMALLNQANFIHVVTIVDTCTSWYHLLSPPAPPPTMIPSPFGKGKGCALPTSTWWNLH